MKKTILITIGLLASVCIFAQVDSSFVSNATTTGLNFTWNFLQTKFPNVNWSLIAVIFGAIATISEALARIKKVKANGIIDAIILAFQAFFNAKK
jgi:hypothetical protein